MATSDRPDTAAQDALWGDTIVRREGDGVPFLVYEPRPRSLHDMLQTGLRWQERTHLVHLGERLTFAGVAERADAVAAALHSRGVAAGDRVMLIGTNSIDYVTTFWGIVAAGAVVVLGNGWWSAAEVDHARTVSEPTLILSSMTRPIPGAISLEEITSEQAVDSAAIGQRSPAYPSHEDAAAVILFTSGSTGAPKGAVLSHRACIALQHTLMHITRRLPGQLGADHPADINLQTGPPFQIGGVQALADPRTSSSAAARTSPQPTSKPT